MKCAEVEEEEYDEEAAPGEEDEEEGEEEEDEEEGEEEEEDVSGEVSEIVWELHLCSMSSSEIPSYLGQINTAHFNTAVKFQMPLVRFYTSLSAPK